MKKFKTKLFTGGGNTAGFWVPEDVIESFNKGKRFPVVVKINNYSYRTMVTTYEGKHAIGVSIEVRKNANVKVGDEVEIILEYDDKPREVEVPDDMQSQLNKDPKIKELFENLAYSHKKEYVMWINEAKKTETRASRLQKLNKLILEKAKV
ncbi:MAG TPA: YdeI/OmpD-associated family protein [Candidatus Dojkabacteria bacterium]|jgi:hypothetical protein